MKLLLCCFFAFVGPTGGANLFDWLGWSEGPKTGGGVFLDRGVPLLQVPFEELSPEEKFLVEASKITGLHLSRMDVCQHRLVLKLKSSCAQLSEEDLARLSVNLLNCQLAAEEKAEFPCTENMSLKACTKDMGGEAWNAYHVLSNRARAVCYEARQHHFRTVSELTVNRLGEAARAHIATLNALQNTQERLEGTSRSTLDRLTSSSKRLLGSNNAVLDTQAMITANMEESRRRLAEGGEAVLGLHARLNAIADELNAKLDGMTKRLSRHSKESADSHEELLSDSKALSEALRALTAEIERGAEAVAREQASARAELDNALNRLREINASVERIAQVVETLRTFVEDRFTTFSQFVGDNGENLERWFHVLAELSCLLLAMLASTFVGLPPTPKAFLLLAAPFNMYAGLEPHLYRYSVPTHILYLGYLGLVLVEAAVRLVMRLKDRKDVGDGDAPATDKNVAQEPARPREAEETYRDDRSYRKVDDWLRGRDQVGQRISNGHASLNHRQSRVLSGLNEDKENEENRSTVSARSSLTRFRQSLKVLPSRNQLRDDTPARSITESNMSRRSRTPCLGVCKNGQKCRNTASGLGALYCRVHATPLQ